MLRTEATSETGGDPAHGFSDTGDPRSLGQMSRELTITLAVITPSHRVSCSWPLAAVPFGTYVRSRVSPATVHSSTYTIWSKTRQDAVYDLGDQASAHMPQSFYGDLTMVWLTRLFLPLGIQADVRVDSNSGL